MINSQPNFNPGLTKARADSLYALKTSGFLTSGQIADSSIFSGNIASGQIGGFHLESGLITAGSNVTINVDGNNHYQISATVSGGVAVSTLTVTSGLALNSGSFFDGSQPSVIGIASGGVVSGLIGNGSVNSGSIASGSIGTIHFASGLDFSLKSGQVTSGYLGDASVVSGSIASGSIGANHIASGVVAGFITSGFITSGLLGDGAVNSGNIASGSVGQFAIASGSITAEHIASGAVINADVADNAVTSGKIASGQVGQFHLSSGAVNSGQIGNAAVNSGNLASGSVGAVHVASGVLFEVTNPSDNRILTSLASGTNKANAEANFTYDGTTVGINSTASGSTVLSVTGFAGTLLEITDQSSNVLLQVGQISGSPILSVSASGLVSIAPTYGQVITNKIYTQTTYSGNGAIQEWANASGTVVASIDGIGRFTGILSSGIVISGNIASGQIGAYHLASGVLFTLSSGIITSGYVGNNAVNSGNISSGAVGQYQIASGSITAEHIASGAIINADIADNAITSGKIGSGQVGGWHVASGLVLAGSNVSVTVDSNNNYTINATVSGGVAVEPLTVASGLALNSGSFFNGSQPAVIGIASGGVVSGLLGDGSVNSGTLASGSIGLIHFASGLSFAVQSGQITSGLIGNNAVVSGSIASGQIGANHIASGVLFSLSSGVITSGYVGNNAINSGNIASGSIGAVHVASGVLFEVTNPSDNRILTSLASGTNKANGEASFTYDGTTVGIVSVASGSTVLSVTGFAGTLLEVTDANSSNLFEVGQISGAPILSVSASGLIALAPTFGQVVTNKIYTQTTYSGNGAIQEWANASGTVVASIDGIGRFTGILASGIVISGSIASGQIGANHLASGVMFSLSSGIITSGYVGNNAVNSGNISSGAVGQYQIASGSITAEHIASGAIINADIADNAVTSGKIGSGQVGGWHVASGLVLAGSNVSVTVDVNNQYTISATVSGGVAVSTLTVTSGLALNSGAFFDGSQPAVIGIASGGVVSGLLGNGSVNSGTLASGSIGLIHFASGLSFAVQSGQITSGLIANNAVVSGSIASGQIAGVHIADATITNAKLVNNLIIINGSSTTLGGSYINANLTIGSGLTGGSYNGSGAVTINIGSGLVTSGMLANNSVNSGNITSGSIGTIHLASGATFPASITSGQVTSGLIGNNAVNSGNISSGQISLFHLSSGAVGSGALASGQVTAFKLGSGAVVSGTIASGQVGIFHHASGVLFSVTNASDNRILTSLASGTNQANAESALTYDGTTLALAALSGTNAVNITGNAGTLFSVTDLTTGNLLEVGSISGTPQLSVNYSGAVTLATSFGEVYTNRLFTKPTLSGNVTVQEWQNASGTAMASINASGVFTGYLASGIVVSGNVASGQIGQFHIASGSITSEHIASGAVINADIANNAVTSGKIGSGQVGGWHIASGLVIAGSNVSVTIDADNRYTVNATVSGGVAVEPLTISSGLSLSSGSSFNGSVPMTLGISSGGIISNLIANDAVVSGKIASGSIGQFALSSGSVNSGHLGNNSVVSGSVASGQIGQFHIASGSITAEHIASGAVIPADISDNAVTSGKIASGVVGWFNLSSGSVRSGHLSTASVISGNIASGQIGSVHISSGTLFNITNASDNRIITSLASGTNQGNAEANLTFDGQTLSVVSTASGSNVVSVTGINGDLFTVADVATGVILDVGNISGNPIMSVHSSGLVSLATNYGSVNTNRIFVTPTLSGAVNVQEWKNASGTTMASINASGVISGYLANGMVVSGSIASGQIGSYHIASGSIISGLLSADSVNTNNITDGSVTNAKLANSSIAINGSSTTLGGSYNNSALTIGSGLTGGSYNGSGAVTVNIGSGLVVSGMLANNSVNSGNITSGSIGLIHIASGATFPAAIQSGQITSGYIGNNAVVSGSIGSGQIGGWHILSGLVQAGSNVSVTVDVNNNYIVNATVSGGVAVEPLTIASGLSLASGTVFNGSVAMTLGIASGGIVSNLLADNSIVSGKLASGSVSWFALGSGVVNSGNIASGQISSQHLGVASGLQDFGQLTYDPDINNFAWEYPKTLTAKVKNGAGVIISGLAVVYVSGAVGSSPSVGLAQATSDSYSLSTFGVATANIGVAAEGQVVTQGILRNVNTSAFAAGDTLWLSPTVPGGVTTTKPQAPDHLVLIGWVLNVANNGSIEVNIQNGYELDELHNVKILSGTVNSGQVLQYSSGLWWNQNFVAGNTNIGSGAIVSGGIASGQIGGNHIAQSTITNGNLVNNSITINGASTTLGGSYTLSSLTAGAGLTGGPYNGSGAITISVANAGITNVMLGSGAVTSGIIASGQVGTFHIASGSITSDLIASGAVINADVADNAVTSGKIASGTIGTLHISSGGVSNVNIANNSVTSGNIASGQIGRYHISSGSIVSGLLASGTLFSVTNFANNRLLTSVDAVTANAEADLTYDGMTLDLNSTASGSTVFQIDGVQQQILKITDKTVGDLLQVGNLSGNPIFVVHSDGYTKPFSALISGQTSNINLFSIPDTSGAAAFFDYYVQRTDAIGWRAGSIMTVWDAVNNNVEFNETATNDLGTSTSNLTFSASISSNNFVLAANIASGTYNIKLGARLL